MSGTEQSAVQRPTSRYLNQLASTLDRSTTEWVTYAH